jgi:L-2-hydroxycarboxylate dehydrogenase (NAD+)
MTMPVLRPERERQLIVDALVALAIRPEDADCTADVLVEADLRGYGSHGLARLPLVTNRIRDGSVDPGARPEIEPAHDQPAALRIDGHRSLGPPAVIAGLAEATRRARQLGTCSVAAYNHSYIAYLGRYVERCVENDCVALLLSNALTTVHPYGGRQRLLGTNPIAVAIPTEGEPVLIDLATSAASAGKLQAAARAGRLVPSDWAIDPDGQPTTHPSAGLAGALSPLGGAKGYALGLLVEALARLLARSEHFEGPDFNMRDQQYWWSSFAVVIHIGSLLEPAVFRRRVSEYVELLKGSPVAPGFAEILMPGERAYRTRRERLDRGIPIEDQIWASVTETCRDIGVNAHDYVS